MIESYSYRRNDDYLRDVARGGVVGASPISAYGRRVVSGIESNILWPDGVYALPPAAGVQLSFVSTNAADAAGGTGIRTVHIQGLDANLAVVSEYLTLDGTTPVLTTRTDWRFIQCVHMVTFGSGKKAAGVITGSVGAQVYTQISAGAVRCASSVRMVPQGKRCLVLGSVASIISGTSATNGLISLVSQHFDGHDYSADSVFVPFAEVGFQDNSLGFLFPAPVAFYEGAAIGLYFEQPNNKAATLSGSWFGILEDL